MALSAIAAGPAITLLIAISAAITTATFSSLRLASLPTCLAVVLRLAVVSALLAFVFTNAFLYPLNAFLGAAFTAALRLAVRSALLAFAFSRESEYLFLRDFPLFLPAGLRLPSLFWYRRTPHFIPLTPWCFNLLFILFSPRHMLFFNSLFFPLLC